MPPQIPKCRRGYVQRRHFSKKKCRRKKVLIHRAANIFLHQNVLAKVNLSPLQAIDEYNGVRDKSVKADFYDDCTMIPEAYYTRGRHNNCDTIYISQNYFRLPRQTIRENANFIILFPQDAKNLTHIYADHCDGDMPLEEFKKFCRRVWSATKHNFVTIDLTSDKLNGKY